MMYIMTMLKILAIELISIAVILGIFFIIDKKTTKKSEVL